jgi:PAS domain S-box-containing protein
LICDTIEFVRVTTNKGVNNDETQTNSFRILVVDDDRSVLKLYRNVLSRVNTSPYGSDRNPKPKGNPYCPTPLNLTPQSFDVVTCLQADEAVEAVKDSLECSRPFSVVFIDIRMPPGPDGIWAAEQIRALDGNIEIVIITGHTDIHPLDISCRIPPAHKLLYTQKPFQPWEILQFASALSMKWHTEGELKTVHKDLEARVEEKTKGLKKVNEKLDGIITSVTDHMSMIDNAYTIVWQNLVGKKLFGEHVVGKKCYTVYHGRANPCQECMVQKTFSDGGIHEQETEVMGTHGNKMIFWCTCNVAERDERGYSKSVLTIHRNITELKQAEKQLQKANHELVLKFEKNSNILSDTLKKMKDKEKDLIQHKSNLEKLNKEMIETNQALSVLARNVDKNKEVFEKKIYETCTAKILPILKDLKSNKNCQRIMADLDVLETNLNSLFYASNNNHEIINILTDQEMRVAALIKRGLTTQKISNLLCISEETVKTHRKNIRKKFKIKNSSMSISSYLKSIMPSDLIRESQAQVHGPDLGGQPLKAGW